ncbi:MAG: sigma-54 dependent transcriptional regulator [Deltaproteobacteria bacterium]|nr:sigma-54 dependent transcriptional regulator [Deltaproteobacteria bacterium]
MTVRKLDGLRLIFYAIAFLAFIIQLDFSISAIVASGLFLLFLAITIMDSSLNRRFLTDALCVCFFAMCSESTSVLRFMGISLVNLMYSFFTPGVLRLFNLGYVVLLTLLVLFVSVKFENSSVTTHIITNSGFWDVIFLCSANILLLYLGSFFSKSLARAQDTVVNIIRDAEVILNAFPFPVYVYNQASECIYRNQLALDLTFTPDNLLHDEYHCNESKVFKAHIIEPDGENKIKIVILFEKTMLDAKSLCLDQDQKNIKALSSEKPSDTIFEERLIVRSNLMKKIKNLILKVANTDSTVLITGESGTGKSLIARVIHDLSSRNSKPFVAVDCASIPPDLLESELFGSVKGAFTGATDRKGLFQSAHGGTVFLDEIGELPISLQVKLLRVIQERKIKALGKTEETEVDVRIICATNKNLEEAVKKGLFREDLYYRINVLRIPVPPLRERKEEIPHLISAFLSKKNVGVKVSEEALKALMNYDYPGNVRELENILERALVLSGGEAILSDHIQFLRIEGEKPPSSVSIYELDCALPVELESFLSTLETKLIKKALSQTDNNRIQAAKLLGLTPRSLRYRIQKLNLRI